MWAGHIFLAFKRNGSELQVPLSFNMAGVFKPNGSNKKQDHVPHHPSNHQNVSLTERFRHVLAMVLDHSPKSKSIILGSHRSDDPLSLNMLGGVYS